MTQMFIQTTEIYKLADSPNNMKKWEEYNCMSIT